MMGKTRGPCIEFVIAIAPATCVIHDSYAFWRVSASPAQPIVERHLIVTHKSRGKKLYPDDSSDFQVDAQRGSRSARNLCLTKCIFSRFWVVSQPTVRMRRARGRHCASRPTPALRQGGGGYGQRELIRCRDQCTNRQSDTAPRFPASDVRPAICELLYPVAEPTLVGWKVSCQASGLPVDIGQQFVAKTADLLGLKVHEECATSWNHTVELRTVAAHYDQFSSCIATCGSC
jgi:hypothetical protein